MDAVNAFNQELFSLMDSKPPISRAKMISITKSAIKAMKLYKHVVQIVEKFIKKCKPEYKVAGLYVVDSIVRQSRHQFGPDKDVFGPRFTKNITGTFENLCLCPVEDRSKIVRVLNLWQKNGVFKIEVIQPLLDMAAGTSSAAAPYTGPDEPGSSPSPAKEPLTAVTANSTMASAAQLQNSDAFAAVAQLFQGQQLQQMLQNFQQQPVKPETETPPPLHTIQTQPQNITTNLGAVASQPLPLTQPTQHKTAFDKKLLDRFDYDDEPETGEETKKGEISSQPSFMQQLPAFSQHMEHFKPPMINMSQDPLQQVPLPPNGQLQACGLPPGHNFPVMMPPMGNALPGQPLPSSAGPPGFPGVYPPLNIAQQQQDLSMDTDHLSVMDGRHGRRSHSGSRSPKRRRSRSNSHTRRSRHTRSRSRSRDRRYHSPRSSSQDCREKERERRQKGLPPLKTKTLSVCSTTLWVGQLDKRTQQQDVACLLEEFGQIESISMIPPRGCAYIVMIHRQDAYRALQKLSRGNYKVNQKAIKIAWALNKGIKAEFKQYWDVDLGVTYIPWSKIKEDQLEEVKEGGILDIDTLSPAWTSIRKTLDQQEELTHNGRSEPQQPEEMHALPLAAPAVPPAQAPPTQQPIPGVGSLQPPVFPGPIGMPPPSFPPGIPPPPFIRPGFNPMQMPPGFPPPGAMPVGHPPSSKVVEDLPLDPAGLGGRKNDEPSEVPNIFNNQMGPLGNQVVPVGGLPAVPPVVPVGGPPGVLSGVPTVGPPGVLPGPSSGIPGPPGSLPGAPPGNIHPPSSGLLGARPGIIPLQRPPLTPPQHMPHFPPPHGLRPPHSSMPPLPPQMMPRGPHPQMMHHEPPPPKGGFGMPLPHNMRPPFPPHGHGPPPPQVPPLPPPFIRPVGPRDLEVPEEMDSRPFRGDRTGFRDQEPERERDWDQDRDRDRDRGFGGRRSFGDGGRGLGADRIDARETLGGWQEDGGDYRGGGWDRDRDRERDRDRDRERDRDRDRERDRDRNRERDRDRDRERDRRDWREKRSSLDRDRERGRVGDDGERESGRGETGERGRGDGVGRERGRGAEGKEGERPRRERRERTTRWDRDDRLAELENMDRFRTPNNTGQPRVTPVVTVEACKEPSIVSPKQTESELVAAAAQVPTAASGPIASDLLPSAQKEPTETTQEAAS